MLLSHFTFIPKTGIGIPKSGIIFYCDANFISAASSCPKSLKVFYIVGKCFCYFRESTCEPLTSLNNT